MKGICKRDLSKECDMKYKDCVDCVLDEISAEIEELQKMCDKNDLNLMSQYSAFGMVLDIIDKYRAESEEA